jgi:hypothetical protein
MRAGCLAFLRVYLDPCWWCFYVSRTYVGLATRAVNSRRNSYRNSERVTTMLAIW